MWSLYFLANHPVSFGEEFDVVIHQVRGDIDIILVCQSFDGFDFVQEVLEVFQNAFISFFSGDVLVFFFFDLRE